MRRRGFITILAGAAGWPLAGRGQQPERVRRIGALMLWSENDPLERKSRTAFERAPGRFGWVEGKNTGSTTASPQAIRLSSRPTLPNWLV